VADRSPRRDAGRLEPRRRDSESDASLDIGRNDRVADAVPSRSRRIVGGGSAHHCILAVAVAGQTRGLNFRPAREMDKGKIF
jgi:hypothetical protein